MRIRQGWRRKSERSAKWINCSPAALRGEKTLAELAQEFDIHPTWIGGWRSQLPERATSMFGGEGDKSGQRRWGSIFYPARPARRVPDSDPALMRRIDELHLEHPFMGARLLRDTLDREGFRVGHRHVATLMVGKDTVLEIVKRDRLSAGVDGPPPPAGHARHHGESRFRSHGVQPMFRFLNVAAEGLPWGFAMALGWIAAA